MNSKKERAAIERLKMYEPDDGYYLAYSGGKDSDCIKILAQLAGVKFQAVHNLTTVDAPETVQYIKAQSDVIINRPDKTMWQLITYKRIPPTRKIRYCCSELKERGGAGKIVVTGVRWAESVRRRESCNIVKIIGKPKSTQKMAEKIGAQYRITRQGGMVFDSDNILGRELVESCYKTRRITVNPIVDWLDNDVWEFLRHYGCEGNPLYQCGFRRIGCIGCPMASKRERLMEFARWPKYQQNYIRAFDRMIELLRSDGKNFNEFWETGERVFHWWIDESYNPNQLSLFDFAEEVKNDTN